MKKKLTTKLIVLTLIINVIFIANSHKIYAEAFPYSDAMVENFAAAMTSEIGCGHPETFVYQLMWSAILINNHYYDHEHNNITASSLCSTIKKHYTPDGLYCNYTFSKLYTNRSGTCTSQQESQAKLAAKMALARSFNLPSNIVGAAEWSVVSQYGTVWFQFQPEVWSDVGYYWYPNNQTLSTKDVYGNTVRTDVDFYRSLATCLKNNPTLFYAYNNCPGGGGGNVVTTSYYVYLYPNGGTGISEGQKFEYTGTTKFSEFPKVTKTNCTLEGWNVDSPDGTKYYSDVDATDNGKKLYARWNCQNTTSTGTTHTVTFKLNDGTDKVYKTEQVADGGRVNFPAKPQRDGYNFYGWVDEAGNLFYYANPIKADTVIYAQWVVKQTKSTSSNTEKTTGSTKNANGTNKQQTNTAKTTTTANDDKEEINNPQTGSTTTVIALILIVLSFVGISYYNKYYKIAKNDI